MVGVAMTLIVARLETVRETVSPFNVWVLVMSHSYSVTPALLVEIFEAGKVACLPPSAALIGDQVPATPFITVLFHHW